jgi:tetratricopeptide (TPR) repeat protein
MRRQIRFGRLAILLLGFLFLGGTAYLLHKFQFRRNVMSLLTQADLAETKGAPDRAIALLENYLKFRPDDDESFARFSLLLDKAAKTIPERVEAWKALNQAVRRNSGRTDVLRRAAMLSMNLGQGAQACEHFNALLQTNPGDAAELEDLLGQCHEGDGRDDEAGEAYAQSLEHGPGRVETAQRLAALLIQKERPNEAGKVMDELVKNNPASAQARLARARFLRNLGKQSDANEDVEVARKLAPDSAEGLLALVEAELDAKNVEEAKRLVELGLKDHSDEPRFVLRWAQLKMQEGKDGRDEAVKRLREAVKTFPDRKKEYFLEAANLFINAREPEAARAVIDQINRDTEGLVVVEFLLARLDASAGQYAKAAERLERSRPMMSHDRGLSHNVNLVLAICYERLGNKDRCLAAAQRAAEEAPTDVETRLALASAYLAVGEEDKAETAYRRVMRQSLQARLAVVRLLTARTLRLPQNRRDWKVPEAVLDDAPKGEQNSLEVRLLRAELAGAQGKTDEARKILNELCRTEPKEIRPWLLLAALAARETLKDGAIDVQKPLAVLDEAEQALGDTVELRLARADYLALSPRDEAVKGLAKLEQKRDQFDKAEQGRLLRGLGEACARAGASGEAERLFRLAVEHLPNDLGVHVELFDAAAAAGDDAALPNLITEIKLLEGKEGAIWRYCEAVQLVKSAKDTDPSDKAAIQLLAEVRVLRPSWPQPLLLEARIAERRKDFDTAIQKYQQAIEFGARGAEPVQRAVRLLTSQRRFEDARLLVNKLGETPLSGELGRAVAELSLFGGDNPKRLLKLDAVQKAENAKDFREQLWLGHVLAVVADREQDDAEKTARRAEAVKAFRQAVDLKKDVPETWVTLILFLVELGAKDEAAAELEKAKEAVPHELRPTLLGPCYQALGKQDDAEQEYLRQLEAHPGDPSALRNVASFYLSSGQSEKAKPHLEALLKASGPGAEGATTWARRSLAMSLAASGDFQKSTRALELLEQNLRAHTPPDPVDQRAKALVMALRPGGTSKSIDLLKESFERLRPTPDEEFLLARLHEANHDWPEADKIFLRLVNSRGETPQYLAYYAQALLRHLPAKEASKQAKPWVAKLEKLEPKNPRTIMLKARLLHPDKKDVEAVHVLNDYVKGEPVEKKEAAVLIAASLLDEFGLPGEAEPLYRQYAELKGKPGNRFVYALFLARQGKVSPALDMIAEVRAQADPVEAVRAAVAVVCLTKARKADRERVGGWVQEELRKNPTSPRYLTLRADLDNASENYKEAVKQYKAVLENSPKHVLALNNLAWLLATNEEKPREALDLVNRAVEAAGPAAELLDTRGVIFTKLNRTDEAIHDLEDAATQTPTAAIYYHLSQAYRAAERAAEADTAWLKAKEAGLKEDDLHALERPELRRLLEGNGQ